MKKAIISGSLGLIGKSVANYLLSNDIEVLCLGRKNLKESDIKNHLDKKVDYISLDMESISELPERIKKLNWEVGDDCIFYNFAWAGVDRLTDGNFKDQLKNAINSSLAVKTAKKIGCKKFINSGSIEENYSELALKKSLPYLSSQANYALSKLAARDMCSMVAYLEKIDYVHTRLSAPLSPDLSKGGYISKTLKKIINNENYETPKNTQLYDIISTNDVAKAYYLIGTKGKNKENYFIGTGKLTTLDSYFYSVKQTKLGIKVKEMNMLPNDDIGQFFSLKSLRTDTGFIASTDRLNLLGFEEIK